jgi:predicted permease
MDEEIAFHLEMEAERLAREGVEPGEARRRARVAFGGIERQRQRLRDGRTIPVLEPLWTDVRFAFRSLVKTPLLAVVAALTIALGVGATTAVFSVVNMALLRPLPIPDADRIKVIREVRSGAVSNGLEGMHVQYPRYEMYREAAADVFQSLAAHRMDEFSLRLESATLAVEGALTSGNYFQVLGVEPALGRSFSSDQAHEVVISHDLWLARFGGDPGAVGRSIYVDGTLVVIVGVAPAGFLGPTVWPNHVWAPVGIRGLDPTSWSLRMTPFGRLHPGVSAEGAAERVHAIGTVVPAEEGTTVRAVHLDAMSALPPQSQGQVVGFLGLLLGMAFLVLLIAAANIAGVMMARALARRREVGIRLALGAGRPQLVRHLLMESLLVTVAGGVAGVALAYGATGWLARMPLPPQVPIRLDLTPDRTVLLFALTVTMVTGVVFGLVPALKASRPDLVSALKDGGHGASDSGGRTRTVFVGGQIAFAVLLLLTAGLFARSLQAGLRADLGFEPEGVVATVLDLGAPHDYSPAARERFFREVGERAAALPGVQAVGWSTHVLLSGNRMGADVTVADDPAGEGRRANAGFNTADAGYLQTLGLALVAGRWIRASDDAGASPVAVVNERLADLLFPGQNPIGRRIRVGGEREVVGVVRDGRYVFVTESPAAYVFLPMAQELRAAMAIHARAPGSEGRTLRGIEEIVRALDPNVALKRSAPMADLIGFGLFPHRFASLLVGAFGVIGLVLAALGIYGVLAYHVALRTREFGVRRALGAEARDIVKLVMGQGGTVTAVGLAIGVAAGAGVAGLVRSFLFGVEPLDAVTFLSVPALLLCVALTASLVPALRATRTTAVEALRET